MFCKCKNTDRPSVYAYFYVGQIYQWYWYNGSHTMVRVMRADFLMPSKIMSREDFLHCFEVV